MSVIEASTSENNLTTIYLFMVHETSSLKQVDVLSLLRFNLLYKCFYNIFFRAATSANANEKKKNAKRRLLANGDYSNIPNCRTKILAIFQGIIFLPYSKVFIPLFLSKPSLRNTALEHAIRRVQANQEDLKLNGTRQLLVYADDVNTLGGSTHTTRKNTEALAVTSKEIGLEINAEKTKKMLMSRDQHARQNHNYKPR
jgi:hypothetical protein